jgi:hypothetical protein
MPPTTACRAWLLLAIMAPHAYAQTEPTGATGTWQSDVAPNPTMVLKVSGNTVTGTISTNATAAGVDITEGSIDGNTIVLKVQAANNGRTVTFTGTLDGDEIKFTREVVVPKGADPGGNAILGAGGPPDLRVYRIIEASRWTGTARNAPTPRNPNPQPNPRPIGLAAKKTTSPHWRWSTAKHLEVRTFSLANQMFELTSYELDAERLQFTFNQNQNVVTCRLTSRPKGPYEGTCAGDGGGMSLLVELTPPEPEPAPAAAAPAKN